MIGNLFGWAAEHWRWIVGIIISLQLALVVLRYRETIGWNWWLVLLPLIIGTVAFAVFIYALFRALSKFE
jgi:hypothetical protein